VAGTGSRTGGEGGPATQAALTQPSSWRSTRQANLYVADVFRVLKIDTHGILTRYGARGRVRARYRLGFGHTIVLRRQGVATDAAGDVFVAAGRFLRLRRMESFTHSRARARPYSSPVERLQEWVVADSVAADAAGILLHFGDGYICSYRKPLRRHTYDHRGHGSEPVYGRWRRGRIRRIRGPSGIAIDSSGGVYRRHNNNRIRMIDRNGKVTTVAGAGGSNYDQNPACIPITTRCSAIRKPSRWTPRGALHRDTGKKPHPQNRAR